MAHQGRSLEGVAPLSHLRVGGLFFGEFFVIISPLHLAYIPFPVLQYKCKEDTGRETPKDPTG